MQIVFNAFYNVFELYFGFAKNANQRKTFKLNVLYCKLSNFHLFWHLFFGEGM